VKLPNNNGTLVVETGTVHNRNASPALLILHATPLPLRYADTRCLSQVRPLVPKRVCFTATSFAPLAHSLYSLSSLLPPPSALPPPPSSSSSSFSFQLFTWLQWFLCVVLALSHFMCHSIYGNTVLFTPYMLTVGRVGTSLTVAGLRKTQRKLFIIVMGGLVYLRVLAAIHNKYN